MKVHIASCSQRKALRGGFTLFELMLTLAILVMVTAISVPRLMHRLQRNEIHSTAVSIRSQLNEARRRAVETGVTQLAVIDVQQHQIRIESTEASAVEKFEPAAPLPLPAGIRIAMTSASPDTNPGNAEPCCVIRFHPNGTSSSGSLTLSKAQGASYRLRIDRATGTIRLETLDR